MSNLFRSPSASEESEWLSISDMMAGLMVVFLFIAIVYIRPLIEQEGKIKEITAVVTETEEGIYKALEDEFKDDLPRWDAEIKKDTLLVRFNSPDVLFARGSTEITPYFQGVLDDFFPRYAQTLRPFRHDIEELRIEGHTSSTWEEGATEQESYFGNMELSQDRTRAVLEHVLRDDNLRFDREWVQPLLTANGLSFSKIILWPNGTENRAASRRVEFRIRTEARRELLRIIEELES